MLKARSMQEMVYFIHDEIKDADLLKKFFKAYEVYNDTLFNVCVQSAGDEEGAELYRKIRFK